MHPGQWNTYRLYVAPGHALTLLMCDPRERWTAAHWVQINTPAGGNVDMRVNRRLCVHTYTKRKWVHARMLLDISMHCIYAAFVISGWPHATAKDWSCEIPESVPPPPIICAPTTNRCWVRPTLGWGLCNRRRSGSRAGSGRLNQFRCLFACLFICLLFQFLFVSCVCHDQWFIRSV